MTTIDNIADAVIKLPQSGGTSPYDTSATVTRVVDGTVYVHIDGGVPETPCQRTIDCKAGDVVKIRISGGRAWIIGNATAPPTDDTRAEEVNVVAKKADSKAVTAGKTATDAKIIAEAINQFFWHDTNGAHVTEIQQEDWLSNPSGNNILMNALGVLIRSGLIASASFSAGAITFYAPDGTTEIARFAADGVTIGNSAGRRILITSEELTMYNELSQEDVKIMSSAAYNSEVTQKNTIKRNLPNVTYSATTFTWDISLDATAVAGSNIYFEFTSKYVSAQNTLLPFAIISAQSFAQGTAETKTPTNAITVSYDGDRTFAVTINAPANPAGIRGALFYSSIQYVATETTIPSFAFGLGTSAGHGGFAMGTYNKIDTNNKYALIVGNGTDDISRSDAMTVGWDGELKIAGRISANDDSYINGSLEINGTVNIADSIKRKTYTWSISSIGANEYKSTEVDPPAESGYTPISIAGWGVDGTGTSHVKWVKCHINSSGKLVIGLMNDNSNARTNWTAVVHILYAKS